MSIGICDSCLKPSLSLKVQVNFGVRRKMCPKCCGAADQVERMMSPAPKNRADQAHERWLTRNIAPQIKSNCQCDYCKKLRGE